MLAINPFYIFYPVSFRKSKKCGSHRKKRLLSALSQALFMPGRNDKTLSCDIGVDDSGIWVCGQITASAYCKGPKLRVVGLEGAFYLP